MDSVSFSVIFLNILGTICAIVFSFAAFFRYRKKDDAEEGKISGTLLTELGYIKSGVDDIKRKQEKQDENYVEVIRNLALVEASAASAHKRIDEIAGVKNSKRRDRYETQEA